MASFLTYDIGTTSLKTALIRDDGAVLAVHVCEYTLRAPQPDWVEMAPETYWQALVEGTRAVFACAGVAADGLAAIGFSSQAQTFIPIDAFGKPLHDAIVWVDNRAQAIADEWMTDWLNVEDYRRISGYPWVPASLSAFKIAWLARYMPEAHRAWKFLCLPDYLIYRLTGETATDYVTARMAGLLDLQTGEWHPRMLDVSEITADQLPRVLNPGGVGGQVLRQVAEELGIPAGVPVCVGANDQLVGAVGAGNVRPGVVSETTGTALALIASTHELLNDSRVVVGRHASPDLNYAMVFTVTSAIVLKWFRDLCAPGMSYDEFLMGVEAIPPGCDGLTVLPHFAGTVLPIPDPNVRGAINGLSLAHTRAHIARAIMESCACMLQECLDPIWQQAPVDCVRSLGGAARNDLWLQMKADLLGVPVERPLTDAASLGAAMLAAAGTGHFASITEAADAWYRTASTFTPDPQNYPIYRQVYERYLELGQNLTGGVKAKV